MGDPTGIGPEIIAGALGSPSLSQRIGAVPWTPVVIGRASILQRAARVMQVDLTFEACEDWEQVESVIGFSSSTCDGAPKRIACLQAANAESDSARDGCIDARGGQAAYDCLLRATELCRAGRLAAIVTAPLQKKGMELAGHHWPGHTELLAHLCGVENTAMMLYLPPGKPNHGGPFGLGVIHVTLHMALREIFQWITEESVLRTIYMTENYFSKLMSVEVDRKPRIAVTALNPHGGESGRFGREEIEIIAPAVAHAREAGIDVSGPWAVDTLMPRAARGDFDAVVAMYHDQGHIALKLLDMFEAVNITLGLPIVRTSVAHGTAHDIAWKGIADSAGMAQAIVAAVHLCN
jgi:4-phospho-D-threonate 3-dehydrogenase / 4-phospho-D-erythronate 3-dehydrogenase